MYGTLIRNAGWTFEQCWEQPAWDVFEFLVHLAEYKPDYIILAAAHGMGPNAAKPKTLTEAEMAEQSQQLRSMMPTAKVPAHLREMVEWSKKQDELAAAKRKLKG